LDTGNDTDRASVIAGRSLQSILRWQCPYTNPMIPEATGEPRVPQQGLAVDGQAPVSDTGAKKHFDAFEADFFQQGDEAANLPAELYPADDLGAVSRGGRPLLSAPSLLGLTIVSGGLALVACAALWRSNAPLGTSWAAAPSPSAKTAARPSAAPVPLAMAPTAVAPAADTLAPAEPEPAATADRAPGAAAKTDPTTAEATGAVAKTEPMAGKPDTEAEPVAEPPPATAGQRCKQSIHEKRNKQILTLCPAAFDEDGSDATVAVALAKAEFERGRFARARVWSRKAIAINPDAAEAYVFAGGAEQNQGHRKAAKEAYLQYLRLAPSGRYAAELRTIVRSL
jgi:tetratricopeptide (TPR) repeat protein